MPTDVSVKDRLNQLTLTFPSVNQLSKDDRCLKSISLSTTSSRIIDEENDDALENLIFNPTSSGSEDTSDPSPSTISPRSMSMSIHRSPYLGE